MNIFSKSVLGVAALLAAVTFTVSCEDANEYEDANTDNPSWVKGYNDSTAVAHPESLANTKWTRGTGLRKNVYGEEVQGFVETLNFEQDSVVVKMSQGATEGTWTDDSNTPAVPKYEYTYSEITGKVEILKQVKDEKGKVSKSVVFMGIVVSGDKEVLTIVHYGDTPIQTYLVKN